MTTKPTLDASLAMLTAEQLRQLVRTLVADQPALIDALERIIVGLPMGHALSIAAVATPVAVDMDALRRELRKDFRNLSSVSDGYHDSYRGGYYDDDYDVVDSDQILRPHLERVNALLDAGDAATATAVIATVIDEWGAGTADLDESIIESNIDSLSEAAQELGAWLAETLLSQDLAPDERARWQERIKDWETDIGDLGMATTAVEQGWDDPALVDTLQGHSSEQGLWNGEAPDFADDLTLVRLRVLHRQGRTNEYLHLAAAEGQVSLYINMLARTGATDKAVAEALDALTSPQDILSLAQILVEQGQRDPAFRILEHGLELDDKTGKQALARWTCAQAEATGRSALALKAAQTAFTSGYELSDYQTTQRLAGEQWPVIKPIMLEALEQAGTTHKINVYLVENMLVEAMTIADLSWFGSDVERVIAATKGSYPDWGIQKYKGRAERIMDAGKANHYDSAVDALRLARDIYLQHNRRLEWRSYLEQLLAEHGRKYKLVPMLRAIW